MQLMGKLPKADLAKNCPKFKVLPFQLDKSAGKDSNLHRYHIMNFDVANMHCQGNG
jgi:hypothetical protein